MARVLTILMRCCPRCPLLTPAGTLLSVQAYEVGKCQNVLSEEGLGTMQRIAEQVNSTHISILEYPPMSGCDENLGGYVLEWVQYDNKCNQVRCV